MRHLLPAVLLAASLDVNAGSLEGQDQVDLIELEVSTARALLVVLLEEDRVNTKPAMKAVFQKVNNYLGFAASGQVKVVAPNASDSLAPKIVVYGPRDATSAEMQNLAGLKLAGKKAGVEVEVYSFQAGIKPRPVAIKPVKRSGARLHTDRLHITLHSLGDYAGAVPQGVIDAAVVAAATVVHPPMDIVFDRALSFAGRKAGKNAFVLCGRDTAAVIQLGLALGLALKRAGLRPQPSGKPHMTMLCDERVIEEHAVEPIRWTASEFVLVLSHLGKTHHERLARWPLTPTR